MSKSIDSSRTGRPLYVTFDTNAYSDVAQPRLLRIFTKIWSRNPAIWSHKLYRLQSWYLNRCVRLGRIVACIPEPALKVEVIPQTTRISLLIGTGTVNALSPPAIDPIRQKIIESAFDSGFSVLRSPRIAYGAVYPVPVTRWADEIHHSQTDRQKRESRFVRHFNNFPLVSLQDLGEKMSAAHGLAQLSSNARYQQAAKVNNISLDRFLWREGLQAEETNPISHASQKDYQRKLRTLLSDWVDFDIVAAHHAYGYDILCTNENRRNRTGSIFAQTHDQTLAVTFNVKVMNVSELARHCWKQFRYPFLIWRRKAR